MKKYLVLVGICSAIAGFGLYINRDIEEIGTNVDVVEEVEIEETIPTEIVDLPTNDLSEHSETLESSLEVGIDDVARESDRVVVVAETEDTEKEIIEEDELTVDDSSKDVNETFDVVEEEPIIEEIVVEEVNTENVIKETVVDSNTDTKEDNIVNNDNNVVVENVEKEDNNVIVEEPIIEELTEDNNVDVVDDTTVNNNTNDDNNTFINDNGEEIVVNEDMDNLKPGDWTTANGVFLKPVQYGGDMGGGRGDIEADKRHGDTGQGAQATD